MNITLERDVIKLFFNLMNITLMLLRKFMSLFFSHFHYFKENIKRCINLDFSKHVSTPKILLSPWHISLMSN